MHRIGNVFSIIIWFSIAFIHSFSLLYFAVHYVTHCMCRYKTHTDTHTRSKLYFICYIEMKLMPACVALGSIDCFFFFFFICVNVCMERIDGFADESGCVFIIPWHYCATHIFMCVFYGMHLSLALGACVCECVKCRDTQCCDYINTQFRMRNEFVNRAVKRTRLRVCVWVWKNAFEVQLSVCVDALVLVWCGPHSGSERL